MIEQEKFTDAEMEDFTEIIVNVIESICVFADENNFDRDNIFKYFSQRIYLMSEMATISDYKLKW